MGLFSKPSYFKEWIEKVNIHGLLNEIIEIEKYIEAYLKLAKKNIVEDYVTPEKGFQGVRVAKVLMDPF